MNLFPLFVTPFRGRQHHKLHNNDGDKHGVDGDSKACNDNPATANRRRDKPFQHTLALVRNYSTKSVLTATESSSSTHQEEEQQQQQIFMLSRLATPIQSSFDVTSPRRSLQKSGSSTSVSMRRASSSYTLSTESESLGSVSEPVVLMERSGCMLLVPNNLTVNSYDVTPPKRSHQSTCLCSDPSMTVSVPHQDRRHSMPTCCYDSHSRSAATNNLSLETALRIARSKGRRDYSGTDNENDAKVVVSDGEATKYPYCVLFGKNERPKYGYNATSWLNRRKRIKDILDDYEAEMRLLQQSSIERSIEGLLNEHDTDNDIDEESDEYGDSCSTLSVSEVELFPLGTSLE